MSILLTVYGPWQICLLTLWSTTLPLYVFYNTPVSIPVASVESPSLMTPEEPPPLRIHLRLFYSALLTPFSVPTVLHYCRTCSRISTPCRRPTDNCVVFLMSSGRLRSRRTCPPTRGPLRSPSVRTEFLVYLPSGGVDRHKTYTLRETDLRRATLGSALIIGDE